MAFSNKKFVFFIHNCYQTNPLPPSSTKTPIQKEQFYDSFLYHFYLLGIIHKIKIFYYNLSEKIIIRNHKKVVKD
jgi:hypothetical protein